MQRSPAAPARSRATLAWETVIALGAHPWPGNVREPQNVFANLTVTGPRYGPVGLDALPAALRRTVCRRTAADPTLAEAREDALGQHQNIARAAGELGITRQGLSR